MAFDRGATKIILVAEVEEALDLRRLVLVGQEAQKYDDASQPQFHPRDRELALHIDRYAFAIRVRREEGLLVARVS